MKKFIFSLLIFISFFLFDFFKINSIRAEELIPTWQTNDLQMYNLGNMSDLEKKEILQTIGNMEYEYYNRSKNYAINYCNTDSYYIWKNRNGGFNLTCFEKADYIGSTFTVYSSNDYAYTNKRYTIELDVFIKNSKKYYIFNHSYNGDSFIAYQYHEWNLPNYTNEFYDKNEANVKFMYESNINISFVYDNHFNEYSDILDIGISKYYNYNNIAINNKIFPVGTMFIGKNGEYSENMTITFNVLKIDKGYTYQNEHIIGKTIQASINIKDYNKYVYQYSYDNQKWYNFPKDEWLLDPVKKEFQFTENGTLYIQVINKSDNTIEKSATYTVDDITLFSHNDILYHSYLKIPITDLYDSEKKIWKDKQFIFMSYNSNKIYPNRIQYYFELRKKENVEDNKEIPIMVYMNKNIVDIEEYQEKIANSPTSDPDGYGGGFTLNGGTGGGGGGGGRFDENDSWIGCTSFPFEKEEQLFSTKHYATITITLNDCTDISLFSPNDFTTEYIYIYYNARYYDNVFDAIHDNNSSSENSDNIFKIFESFKFDNKNIKLMINNVWNSLKNSDISKYFMILISGTLIVVLINSINRG